MEAYIIGLWSLFINTLIQTFYSALHSLICVGYDFNESVKITIYVISAVIFPFIIVKALNSNFVRMLLGLIGSKTVHADIFDDVIDYDKRTMMMVYLKDSDVYYMGIFKLREEKGADSNIALINYAIFNKDTDEPVQNLEELGLKSSIVFNLHDVERIQLIYEDDSNIWQWLNKR